MTHFQPYPIGESIDDRLDLFSATVEADLGFAKLTNATGYFNRHMEQSQDASEATSWTLESFLVTPQEMAAIGMPTYISTPIYEAEPEHQWTEELRLNSSNSDTLHWATGLFYSRLNSAFVEQQNAPYIAQLSQFLTPPMNNPTGLTFGIDNLYRDHPESGLRRRILAVRPDVQGRGRSALFPLRHVRLQQRVGLLLHPAGGSRSRIRRATSPRRAA